MCDSCKKENIFLRLKNFLGFLNFKVYLKIQNIFQFMSDLFSCNFWIKEAGIFVNYIPADGNKLKPDSFDIYIRTWGKSYFITQVLWDKHNISSIVTDLMSNDINGLSKYFQTPPDWNNKIINIPNWAKIKIVEDITNEFLQYPFSNGNPTSTLFV